MDSKQLDSSLAVLKLNQYALSCATSDLLYILENFGVHTANAVTLWDDETHV